MWAPWVRNQARRAVRYLRDYGWREEYGRLETLRSVGRGRRAFLLGNAPSLSLMDLSPLADEFVCVANMGIRAVGDIIAHADMHVVLDTHRYRRFADEIERRAHDHSIPYRFLNLRMRRRWRRTGKGPLPYFLTSNPRKLTAGQPVPDMSEGLVFASSVLVSTAVLLDFIGFEEIYVIGCDLDYSSAGEYFYAAGRLDRIHEADPVVAAKRRNLAQVNGQFAILGGDLERRGRRIVNAGLGGNLDTLPRADFANLFATGPGKRSDGAPS